MAPLSLSVLSTLYGLRSALNKKAACPPQKTRRSHPSSDLYIGDPDILRQYPEVRTRPPAPLPGVRGGPREELLLSRCQALRPAPWRSGRTATRLRSPATNDAGAPPHASAPRLPRQFRPGTSCPGPRPPPLRPLAPAASGACRRSWPWPASPAANAPRSTSPHG